MTRILLEYRRNKATKNVQSASEKQGTYALTKDDQDRPQEAAKKEKRRVERGAYSPQLRTDVFRCMQFLTNWREALGDVPKCTGRADVTESYSPLICAATKKVLYSKSPLKHFKCVPHGTLFMFGHFCRSSFSENPLFLSDARSLFFFCSHVK